MGHSFISPCNSCPKRSTCSTICQKLEDLLPRPTAGCKNQREQLAGTMTLDGVLSGGRVDDFLPGMREDMVEIDRGVLDKVPLNQKDRKVAELYWWQGKSGPQIAALLKRWPSSISKQLRRIRKVVKSHSSREKTAI